MINRIRNGKRYFKPQQKIEFEEWEEIIEKAAEAEYFFEHNRRIVGLLEASLADAENVILENKVKEVHEEVTISESLKKIFITPKKIQVDELIGQLKFIRDFISELRTWIDFKAELEKKEAEGAIMIVRSTDGQTG